MSTRSRRSVLRPVWLAVLAMTLVVPASVLATTNRPIAETGGMTATIPLLGSALTVGVTLDDVGDIDAVALDPADTLPNQTTDGKGTSFTNDEGTAAVSVKAKGDSLEIKARTTLEDLLGPGSWSANVFGAGTAATVTYTIGKDDRGKPTITIDSVSVPDGVTYVVKARDGQGGAKHGKGGAKRGSSAKAAVVFSANGFSKTLRLSVAARKDGSAKLSVKLSGRDRQKLTGTLAELAGARTWSARLCDGTPVAVAYHVTDGGAVVFDSVTGAEASVKEKANGFKVRFDGTRVGVRVRLAPKGDDAYRLIVEGRSGRCGDDGHDKGDKGERSGSDKDGKHAKGEKDRDGDRGRDGGRDDGRRGGHGSNRGGGR